MKVQKLKNHSIYKIVNVGNGDEFHLNFRPKKSKLKELTIKKFGWFEESAFLIYRIDIYEIKNDLPT